MHSINYLRFSQENATFEYITKNSVPTVKIEITNELKREKY